MAITATQTHRFSLTVKMMDAEFWRFNLYLVCEMLDAAGERIDYIHRFDLVAEKEPYPTEQPADYKSERVVEMEIGECASARVLLYLIPFALPVERMIDDVPSLSMSLAIAQDGKEAARYELEANPWSGRRLDFTLPIGSGEIIRGR